MNSSIKNPIVSVDDFCEYFMDISPWNQFLTMDGEMNIKRLFDAVDDFKEYCKWETPLVKNGQIDIFVFKTLTFFICRGTVKTKYQLLWDFLEPNISAYGKKRMPHYSSRLKKFFSNYFFFADIFCRRFEHIYCEEIEPAKFLLKYTIASIKPIFEEDWT